LNEKANKGPYYHDGLAMPISSPQITTMFGLVVALDPAIFDLLSFARQSKVLVDVSYSPWG